MKVRLGRGVRRRQDVFGGVCYVPSRDDFFAISRDVFPLVECLEFGWKEVSEEEVPSYSVLASLGICETKGPVVGQVSYSGPSFLGIFPEIPTVSEPLVLNCFSTAHCPLRCLYCHADDLMKDFRPGEVDDDLDNVVATASMIPAMVAVITGGDPLTRPERAERLIRRLAGQKALVLDTSGVGDIAKLLPTLIEFNVHVRISLDSPGDVNDVLRPINPKYVPRGLRSRDIAEDTIMRCLAAGLNVSVQTVVSRKNDTYADLADLRDWLISRGVKHWVLHVAVKGGNARKIEKAAQKKRRGGILPGPKVYSELWRLVEETIRRKLPVDIRCTDTDTSPNSVLLVGSKGDLVTEGYAHDGKVVLYSAGQARPDMLAALWPHIDRFGHARRYLNWNPWFFEGRSLEEICFKVPLPSREHLRTAKQVVETEAKFQVQDEAVLRETLADLGFVAAEGSRQRDEYFDFSDRRLAGLDFVVRMRTADGGCFVSLKGPRFYTNEGDYSRIELEFESVNKEAVREEMSLRGLEVTWFFEKRRVEFRCSDKGVIIVIDEIPEIGSFAEVEGPIDEVRPLLALLGSSLGVRERRNYREIFIAHKRAQGLSELEVKGASFTTDSEIG
jgi:predicted adenylyl cyclase CyaB